MGCPYERAMALMDGDEAAQCAALTILDQLGAQPAVELVRQTAQASAIQQPNKSIFGRLTEQADNILRGGRTAGSLPVLRMKRFAVVINMKVAKKLGQFPPLELLQIAETVN